MWSFMLELFYFYQMILWHSMNVTNTILHLYTYQNQIILIHHILAAWVFMDPTC